MRNRLIEIAILGLCAIAAPAAAQPTPQPSPTATATAVQPSAALRLRAEQMVELFNGKRTLADYFIAEIPVEQFNRNLASVREQFGAATRLSGLEVTSPNSGVATIEFERGQRRMRLRVRDEPPHLVNDFGPAPPPPAG